jgi:hydrogenase maturation protease
VVEVLEVGDQRFQTWQEAEERDVELPRFTLKELVSRPVRQVLEFPAKREWNWILNSDQKPEGVLVRSQNLIRATIEISVKTITEALHQITIRVLNQTPSEAKTRDEALMQSLVSAHTVFGIQNGEFVSMLETPPQYFDIAQHCQNVGTWPVLIGKEGERDTMLSSPIILYDYPQVAPESAGDLFDATEIDEILTLRILTLTEEEKLEARSTDERSRQLLDRTEGLPMEQLQKLHGAIRGLKGVQDKKS